ncbi:unnamed protein product, partial [marine sediment metagenome]
MVLHQEWVSEGKSYLDISTVVNTRKQAEAIAIKNNQEAIFNLETKETISKNDFAKTKVARRQLLKQGHTLPRKLKMT